jgi:peptide/nickel transport system permease protein
LVQDADINHDIRTCVGGAQVVVQNADARQPRSQAEGRPRPATLRWIDSFALLRHARAIIIRLAIVSLFAFLLLQLIPGDPAVTLAGENASLSRVAKIRTDLGLDRPLYIQYLSWVADLVRGDLGRSLISGEPVLTLILQRFPVTFSLTVLSLGFAAVTGIVLGVLAATNVGRWPDRMVSAVASLGIAIPPFWLGLMLVVTLSIEANIMPSYGYTPLSADAGQWLRHLALPALTMSASSVAEIARQMRASLADALERDYIRTARAKGLNRSMVVLKHACKNAAVPVVTVIGLQASLYLAGSVVVETIFGLPGIGGLVYQSVLQRDIPVIQGVVMLSAVIVLIVNMAVDLSYRYFDPRVRLP